jgi:beta-phosphoglucomutase
LLSGVIFDMDGVLLLTHSAHKMAWRLFLHDVGREVPDEDLDFVLDGRKREEILCHFLGELSEGELRHYGEMKDRHFCKVASSIETVPGLFGFLDYLDASGVTAAVATSATERRAHSMLRQYGLTERFRAIVTGSDVAKGKPDPGIFLLAAERIQRNPADVLVVEDAVSGVKAAKSAGMKCLGIADANRAEMLLAAGADHVVPDFTLLGDADIRSILAISDVLPAV